VPLEAARGLARAEKVEFMEFRSGEEGMMGLPARTDKVTFKLNLDSRPETLWEGFDAKLRNQIRKANKSGLTCELVDKAGIEDFYKVFSRNMRDLGTPVWSKGLFREIFSRFPDDAFIALVRHKTFVVAAGLVLAFKRTLYVPSASAYRSCLSLCPNHALYWEVIKFGCENSYQVFDFGRSSWGSGTFRFKKQWSPNPIQLVWEYDLLGATAVPHISPDNPKYRLMIALWRKLPLPLANFIGPRVIRNFP
jgi:FemAB-related protein (PEP-CTERM system-associated)